MISLGNCQKKKIVKKKNKSKKKKKKKNKPFFDIFFFFLRDYPKTRAEGVISLGNCQKKKKKLSKKKKKKNVKKKIVKKKKKKKKKGLFFFFFLRDYPKTRAEGVISLGNCQKKKKKKRKGQKNKCLHDVSPDDWSAPQLVKRLGCVLSCLYD